MEAVLARARLRQVVRQFGIFLRIARFTIREMLLTTAVVALSIPYVYRAGQNLVLPQYQFSITQFELMDWIHSVDATAEARSNGYVGNCFANDVVITVEFDPPGYANIRAIEQGIISKLNSEGWTLNGHGFGGGISLDFHFYKGPSRYRLYVIENASNGFTPPKTRAAKTYRIITIHDSHPDL